MGLIELAIYNRMAMHTGRIAELLAPFLDDVKGQRLTANDLQRISMYIDILLRWNARLNLTAIRDPEQIVTRHFGESLFAACILFPQRERDCVGTAGCSSPEEYVTDPSATSVPSVAKCSSLADIGSGAGFPGVPIKLWQPTIALTLIESNQKKATFLREIARALTLTDINILAARAESLPPEAFDVVTLRAVERFESILPVAARRVSPGGRLALLIGSAQLPLAHSILDEINAFPVHRRTTHLIALSSARTMLVAERSA
jgi:16S rRNA (guanine527-N7)-methyltransferase